MIEPSNSAGNAAGSNSLQELLRDIKNAIWAKRPILGEIMKKHGHKTLFNYASEFTDINPSPRLDERKEELIETATDIIKRRLGPKVASKAMRQLQKFPLVSTADHHGPIGHPFWINANLITALNQIQSPDTSIPYLIVFSFASISLNNASTFTRGLLFHSDTNGGGNLMRLPLLPDKLKMSVVYGSRPINKEDIDNAALALEAKTKTGEISKERAAQVCNLMNKYLDREDILEAPNLNCQITRINYRMWQGCFHTHAGSDSDTKNQMMDLIYIDIETITKEILAKYHLNNESSLIYKLLFNPEFQKLTSTYFNNIPGAFSNEEKWGSWFFWGLDEKKHRVSLFLDDNKLHSTDDKISFDFTPKGISEALQNRQIFPSMMTCYLIVSLYYGMKCLGGFCQVNDLTMLKNAWIKMLRKLNLKEEAEAVQPIQTKELGGDGMVLPYFKRSDNKLTPATGIDMILDGSDTNPDQYIELAKNVSLNEIMEPMLPEMYTVLYPFEQRDAKFAELTPEKILENTKIGEKIANIAKSKCVQIPKITVTIKKPRNNDTTTRRHDDTTTRRRNETTFDI
jgi:hypothetical protein